VGLTCKGLRLVIFYKTELFITTAVITLIPTLKRRGYFGDPELREMDYENWIQVAQSRAQKWAFVNTVMKLGAL
jgi:hypothetical protein